MCPLSTNISKCGESREQDDEVDFGRLSDCELDLLDKLVTKAQGRDGAPSVGAVSGARAASIGA